jgi:hypothetical protein
MIGPRSRIRAAALCLAVTAGLAGPASAAVPHPPDPCDYDPRVDCTPPVQDPVSHLIGLFCYAQAYVDHYSVIYLSDLTSYDVFVASGGGQCPLDHANDELDVDGAVAVIGTAEPADPTEPSSWTSKGTCHGRQGACAAKSDELISEPGVVTIQSVIAPTTRTTPVLDRIETTYVMRQEVFEA